MNNILLVIDVQNGFVRNEETKENAKRISNLLSQKLFDKIISTKFLNGIDSPYYRWLHWPRLFESPDIDLLPMVNKFSDYIIEKRFYSCDQRQLINTLKECNDGALPSHVFICGTDTDCCVQVNSTMLFELGIHPIVLTNYCASNGGPESHKAGLEVMRRTLGRMHLIDDTLTSREKLVDILKNMME